MRPQALCLNDIQRRSECHRLPGLLTVVRGLQAVTQRLFAPILQVGKVSSAGGEHFDDRKVRATAFADIDIMNA